MGISLKFPAFPPFHVVWKSRSASPPGKGGWGGHRSLFNPISRNKYGILKQAGNPNPAFPRFPLFLSPLEGGMEYVQTQPQQSRRAQGWGWELWSSPHPWSSSSSSSLGRKGSAKSQGHAAREPPCPIPSKFGIVFEKNGERVTPRRPHPNVPATNPASDSHVWV